MFAFRPFVAALFFSLPALPAQAVDHWTITDLGSTRTETLCVQTASDTFVTFGQVFGAAKILQASWTVYGYGLNNGNHDAVVTCTFSTANATRATLIVYSENTVTGGIISSRIAQRFELIKEQKEKEWLQKAYDRFGF